MNESGWNIVIARPARRAIDRLPAKIAVAIVEFVLGPLVENPHRVGKPLRGNLAGIHSARVGAYRVIYEIDEPAAVVNVLHIDHRADVYRPR